jgi:endonuclease YncB( thermonuclease family)
MRDIYASRRGLPVVASALVALLSSGLLLPARGDDSASLDLSSHVAYPVLQVIDGDTIVIKYESRGVLMQLRGVEANREGAKTFLRGLLAGESVHLVYAPEGPNDAKGHLSAYFFRVKDKLFLNRTVLSQGYGVANDDAGPHERLFPLIEKGAKARNLGLWSDEDLRQPRAPSRLAIDEGKKTVEHRRALRQSWHYRHNAVLIAQLESEAASQLGTSVLTIKNDRDAKFRVTLRGGLRPVSLVVPAGAARSVSLINERRYQPSFQFADEPGTLYRGDPIPVDDNAPTITIGAKHDGNYPVQKVN